MQLRIDAGNVYMGVGLGEVGQQTTGFLAALDAQSGKEVWRLDAGDYVSCQPLVAGDTVYFGSSDFNVYALDAKTGRSKWTIRTDGQIYKLSTGSTGLLYVSQDFSWLHALDIVNGNPRWSFDAGSMIFPISEVGGILYAGRDPFMGEIPQNAKAYAFRVSDGAEFWSFSPDNSLDPRGAAIVEGRIVFRGDAGIFALDARTGELIWNVEFGINPPFVVEKNIVYATYVHRVIAVDSQDGRWLWSVSGDYEILADPLFALNSVHVGTRDGAVFTLDGISGEELWSTRLDSYISELVASNTTVYAVTSEGIYALRNGRQL